VQNTFPVHLLRRRPLGKKLLVYLDQSTLSHLVRPAGRHLLDVLTKGVKSDRLICPSSPDHDDESVLAPQSYKELHDVLDELSMGISFDFDEDIQQREILNAAAKCFQRPPQYSDWKEAFAKDPHLPRADLFPGGFRVSLGAQRLDWMVAEVERQKAGTEALTELYEQLRSSRVTFLKQAHLEFQAAAKDWLGPLLDAAGAKQTSAMLLAEAKEEMIAGYSDPHRIFGPATSRQMNFAKRVAFCELLLRQYPGLAVHAQVFVGSAELSKCPMLVYPSLIFAATIMTRGRKAKPSDRYDRAHLTRGLSRCDIVTADSGMAQMMRERKLVPRDVLLFASTEHDKLLAHIENCLR
jgi:hypothetical protein